MRINVFNISERFFNDICLHYEKDGNDYVLADRIEFFYQNYSLCNESCFLTNIFMENYSYMCECLPLKEEETGHHKKEYNKNIDEKFSMAGLIF